MFLQNKKENDRRDKKTKAAALPNFSTKRVFIPNEEVRQEFIRAIKASKYTEVAKLILNAKNPASQDSFLFI